MQYYVNCNESGNIIGFYVDEIHGEDIPETAIPIAVEEWQAYSANASLYKLDGVTIRVKTQGEIDDEIAALPPTEPTEIELLREENTMLQLALAELAEAQEADKTDTQLALAELASLLDGGA